MAEVKRRRDEKSRETRRRIIDAAGALFVEQGYGATKLQEIADRAGVAVQTIYFVFRNKPALLKALVDVAIAGDDEPVPTLGRAWFAEVTEAATAEAALAALVAGTRGTLERVAAVNEMVRAAAATNPEIREMWPERDDPRYTVIATAAESLTGKPGARASVTAGEAADVLYGLLSPELFLVLTRDRGWPPDRWERWVYGTLRTQLLDGTAGEGGSAR
ncbi:TetR/AcrR family transcriptional regulator [Actinomadura livida]|uniref:AcrR family transcriptional regulator n=1 Tax=Actinomadura livida TaxID=79909 RepID=A0A7W7I9F2_9ACTN|nr:MULTISPECIES: helix-turn-helix domain-containing protein [Actinomadura]MBB4772873.1 AcrR family transcriptional regulator [Actinomadura catellatispora]GGU13332.1 TetR family transcriptional regulator [Actinomadura livida]